jgi:hypothetical protein
MVAKWVRIVYVPCFNKLFTVDKNCNHGNQAVAVGKNNLKAWLASGIRIYGYILNRLVYFHQIWYRGEAIQEDLDAITFNLTASIILKLLMFKF